MAASQPLTHCRIKCALADLPSSLLRNPASEMHAGKDLSLQKSKIRRNIFRLWRDRKCVTNLSRWVDRWTGTRRDLGFSCGFRQLDVYCWPGVPVQVTRCAPFRYRRVRRTSSGCSHVEPTESSSPHSSKVKSGLICFGRHATWDLRARFQSDRPSRVARSLHWIKVRNPNSPAMTRVKEVEWSATEERSR